VPGLRTLDRPHLCRSCRDSLAREGPVCQRHRLPRGEPLEVLAATLTGRDLTSVVGVWKYHGVRGLAWPLAELLLARLPHPAGLAGPDSLLVPVPLHARRRRSRGFNQAEILARLLGPACGWKVENRLVRRRRDTGQQARITGESGRWANTAGCFEVLREPGSGDGCLILVDDLVTSGATTGALAGALRQAGWRVPLVLALGLARRRDSTGAAGPG
jgi:predicted amidophosphoribosyltransferase